MFFIANIIILFIAALPVSFGIGALTGLLIHRLYRNRTDRRAAFPVICGGCLYIAGQPLSLLSMMMLPAELIPNVEAGIPPAAAIYAVTFDILFTACILIALMHTAKKRNPACAPHTSATAE